MRVGGVPVAALLLIFASIVIQVSAEDIYWEGEEDASNEFLEVKEDDSSLATHLKRIKRDFSDLWTSFFTTTTAAPPENYETATNELPDEEIVDDKDDDADESSGLPGPLDVEPREKTLRVSFVVMQPYQKEYSDRDSLEFQNFSKSLANAVNKLYEGNPDVRGTQRASLVRIQSRATDDFSCKVTLDIVTTGYDDMDVIRNILRDHIRFRRALENLAVSEADFSAKVIDPARANDLCTSDEIRCEDGICVPNSARCDGKWDCSDGADEIGCPVVYNRNNDQTTVTTEPSRDLQENTISYQPEQPERRGQPEPREEVTEAIPATRQPANCRDDQINCDSTRCVEVSRRCDGIDDCDDRTDELNCEQSCGNDDFRCDSGMCIPLNQVCNRIIECPGPNGEDEKNCECTADEFQCVDDGACIELRKRCDGRNHCNDRSDERNCPAAACKSDQWQCDYGNCIKRSKRCDGRVDCPTDRSDERNCVGTAIGYFKCRSGYTIPNSLRCNRRYDCPLGDYSDEQNCPCGDGDFKCANGYCIPASKHCDRTHDCQDGSDERDCNYGTVCMAYEYKCSSGQCVRAEAQCNGTTECLDGSDERDCPCKRDELPCRDGPCINIALRCNGQKNCPQGEDELNCGCPPDQFTCSAESSVPCARRCDGVPQCDNQEDEDNCPGDVLDDCDHECDGQCLDRNKICDGTVDCSDGSDEYQCNKCDGPDDFRCNNGECVNAALRCNGLPDCTDSSDESNCNTSMISTQQCTDDEFLCKNNRCINNQFYCDNNDDCGDYSDEENCRCNVYEWQCYSGKCIQSGLVCDGTPDCPDNSDELNCLTPAPTFPPEQYPTPTPWRPNPVYTTTVRPIYTPPQRPTPADRDDSRGCPRNQWRCENGPCIDLARRCDGTLDCPKDDSDELDCPLNSPPALQLKTYPDAQVVRNGGDVVFQCRDEGPMRVPVRWIREGGRPLKPRSSDKNGRLEMSEVTVADSGVYICQAPRYLGQPGAELRVTLNVQPPSPTDRSFSTCRPQEATCGNGQCIPKSAVCNGKFDCSDRSDEETCNESGMCEPNQFRCDNRRCVLKSWLCDSDDDCGDGSDERNCATAPGQHCMSTEFTCASKQCIPRSFHCDQHSDCMDHSDEIGCIEAYVSQPPRPSNVLLNPGETLTLRCEAVGVPIPLITWRLNWGHIPSKCISKSENGVGSLTCPNMQPEDSGAYSCEALSSRVTIFAAPDAIVYVNRTNICPSGYFNSEARSPSECIRCFCFGESTQCKSADLFIYNMPTPLGQGGTRLVGVKQTYNSEVRIDSQPIINDQYYYKSLRNGATVTKLGYSGYPVSTGSPSYPYLTLPESYNGNQLTSYGGYIRYKVSPQSPRPNPGYDNMPDIIIKGKFETLVYKSQTRSSNPRETYIEVRLTQDNWQKSRPNGLVPATREDIMMALDNIESILLRASVNDAGVNITDFVMESAQDFNAGLGTANLVEECSCPPGYEGLSCQKCSSGYVRENSGPWLGSCVRAAPGPCPPGSYGDPGSGYACQPCPCPLTNRENQFARTCSLGPRGNVICDCAPGYVGDNCAYCAPGYTGNPLVPGDSCQRRPTSNCNPAGTLQVRLPDECECKENVQGRYCDQCKGDTFHLSEENSQGCALCFCTGVTGQCTSSSLRRKTTTVTYNIPQIVDQVNVYESALFTGAGAERYDAPVLAATRPQLVRGDLTLGNVVRSRDIVYYWSLPRSFAGDIVTSYGGYLRYVLRNVPVSSSKNNAPDIQLISENRLTFHYFGNFVPSNDGILNASIQFLEAGWQRPDGKAISRQHFLLALADVKAILVKATYTSNSELASLVSSSIDTADQYGDGPPAAHVEQCVCPQGYLGTSCEDCAPGYTRSSSGLYLESCEPCNCNGHSDLCDPETSVCIDCLDNTAGYNCEECKPGYERDQNQNCVARGAPAPGPDSCNCDSRGIVEPCDAQGYCRCKQNVEGESCDRCRPGTFGLDQSNPDGCTPCYCSGVTRDCVETPNYSRIAIPAPVIGENNGNYSITDLNARQVINDQFVPSTSESELTYIFSYPPNEELFWSLPHFTGNRLLSYGGDLALTQRFESSAYPSESNPGTDIVLFGEEAAVYWSNNQAIRSGESLSYRVPLTERGWFLLNSRTPASRNDFMTVLKNLKRVLIRATLSPNLLSTSIADVSMDTAGDILGPQLAKGIESCSCPQGYTGKSCESCAPGFYQNRGRCQQCNCNGHDCHVGGYGEVVCDCRAHYSGADCSIIGVVMELHPIISENYGGPNPFRRVTFTCKYRAPEPLTIQFYYEGQRINSPKHYNTSKLYPDGWRGEHETKLIWDTKHVGEILECHTITSKGFTLGVLTSTLPEPDGEALVTTTNRPPPPQSTVTVTISSPTIKIENVGGQVNFTCEARSRLTQDTLPVNWTKVDGNLPQGRTYVDQNTGVLFISHVQVSDSGIYVCQTSDGISMAQASASLTVGSNPMTIPTVTIQPSVNEYYEGDRIELECVTTGNPTPQIIWQRASGQPLPLAVENQRSYLIIPRAREEDSGEYRCIARNTAGATDRTAAISVRPRPSRPSRDRLTISPSVPNVVEGQSTNVICTGTANIPVGSIGWIRQDGAELAQNVRSDNGVLYIDVARFENQGVYVCQTTSQQAASVPVLVTVVPLSTPPPGEAPTITVSVNSLKIPTGGSGTIDCNPQGYPSPYIQWNKHNGKFGPGTSQRGNTLIISNAQDEDGGYYMCTGTVDGTVIANTYVMVDIETRIPPKVEIWPPGEHAVPLGGQFEFHCRVLGGVPPPEILWSRSRERQLSPSTHLQPAVLKFDRIEVNDEGEYICTATNIAGQASANATLKVRSIPEITLTPGSFIEVNPGDAVDVHCRANGYPEPMVSIKLRSDLREIVPASPGIASLHIGAASERDDGDYVCTAASAAGAIEEQFTIRVERGDGGFGTYPEGSGENEFENPYVNPDQERPIELAGIEGQDSRLGCDASNDLFTVQWNRVGQALQRNAQQVGNELIIRNASKSDSGQYECLLIDRLTGYPHKSKSTALLVMAPPRITLRPPTQTVRPGQSPTVDCIVEGDDIIDTSWRPVQRPLSRRVQTRGPTLIFRQIEVEDAGTYECFAKNRVANASAFAQVIVNDETDRAAAESHDNEQVAKEGAVVRFSCNVPPQPRLTVRWTKNGQPLPRSVLQLADGALYIRLAKKSDSGHYLCIIKDQYGRQTSNYINLHIEDDECLKPKFRCVDGSNCIDEKLLCDGSADCLDHSDEDCLPSEELQPNTLSDYPTLTGNTGAREVGPALVAIEQPRRQFAVGENVEVICRAASRGVSVNWEKYGTREHVQQRSYGDGSVLILHSVAESDAGLYRCTGIDSSSSSSDDFNLEIIPGSSGPSYPVNPRDETYTARLGDRVNIPCRHNLEQPVSYEWRNEFSSLPPDVRSNEANLYLQQVSEADAGTYICTVSNGRTRQELRAVLLVTGVVPKFNGNSWLAMKRLKDAYLNFDIEISFKPIDSNGLILYNSQNEGSGGDFIALQLVNNVPQMVLELPGSNVIVKGDRPLRLNSWHTARLSRMHAKVTMNVDDTGPFTAELPNAVQPMELTQPLYIGGVPNYDQLPTVLSRTSGFIGCVGMLILGKQEKDIMMDNINKYQVAECDSCSPNLCLHGGICQEARNERGYVCLCPAGYAGQNCDHAGEGCRPRLCGPGKCTETADSYKCSCPITFTGPRCNIQQSIEYPAFTGSAYLAIKPPETGRSLYMSMKIKAMSPVSDGIIMYCAESELGKGGFTSLTVREGRLEFRYQLGDGSSPVILTSRYPLPANEWTEVKITRTGSIVLLRVNQNEDVRQDRLEYPKELRLGTPLYVGGVDDSSIILNNNTGVTGGFMGCIKDVTVQAGPVNIVTASIESNNVTECTNYERGDIPEEKPGLTPPLTRPPLSTRRVPGYGDPCREQPCRNRGTCRPDPSAQFNYSCDCPLGFAGTNCQMPFNVPSPVGFDGNGYLELAAENLHYNENPVVIAVTITSRSDNGVILYHRESASHPANGDYILLRVENGHIVFEWDLGGGESKLAIENLDVSDGLLHNIIVKMYTSKEVELTVDQTAQTGTYEGFASVMNADSNIYLGGIPERLNINGHPGLTGCVVSVEFMDMGRGLDLGAAAVAGRNVQRCREPANKTVSTLSASGDQNDLQSLYQGCLDRHQNFVYQPETVYCNATFDTYLCWPPTPAGAVASQNCPPARLSDTTHFAFRRCGASGLWLGRRPGEASALGWTNYTPCFPPEVQTLFIQVYDDERDAQLKFEIAQSTRYMEIAGFSISLIALLVSLVIFSHYRSLRNNRTRIHKSLFSAMVLQVLIRLTVYIDQALVRSRLGDRSTAENVTLRGIDNMPYLCESSYVLLEYAITVMFMWMFIEGLYLHNVVTANALREGISHMVYYATGWGLPVILTALWAVMTALHYRAERVKTCWYGYNFTWLYWIVQGPRLGVILINLVFLLNIMKALIAKLRRTQSTELEKVRKAVRAALVLLPLLGITNAINMTAAPLDGSVWRFGLWCYSTHFLRSFQGFFIALVYCFLNGEVRQVLKKHYRNYMAMRGHNRRHRDSFFNLRSSSGEHKPAKTRNRKSDDIECAETTQPQGETHVDRTAVKVDFHAADAV